MDDILASIRRILNEEQPGDPAPAAAPPQAPIAPQGDTGEELVLDRTMLVAPPLAPQAAAPQIAESVMPPPPEPSPGATDPAPLLDPDAATRTADALAGFKRALAAGQPIGTGRPGLTLEDLVREELRPLLKHWLDHNLPPLAERVVREEVAHLARRAGL